MFHPRTLGYALMGASLAATAGCVTALPAQRPNETFTTANGPVEGASEDEKNFIEDINKELVKQGWKPATSGENEMKAAKIVARAVYEQRWSSSGVKSSPPGTTDDKPLRSFIPLKAPMAPGHQYAIAYGIVPDFSWATNTADYHVRRLTGSDLEDLVRLIRPLGFSGTARIGVSVLPDSADSHRIFAAVMRDERVTITKGAPRVATPGSSIAIEGKLVVPNLKPGLWVLHPDGKIDESPVAISEDGTFSATYTLPSAPGLYLVSLSGNTGYEVPVFSGVEPTPWPPRPSDNAAPPGDPKDAASQIVQALEAWRLKHGLPILPVKADLCAAAKAEATALAAAEAKNRGDRMDYQGMPSQAERLRTAGVDPSRTSVMNLTWRDDVFIYHLAHFPDDPITLSKLASPNAEALGVGATYLPRESLDDPNFYRMVWIVSNREAPKAVEPPAAVPPAEQPPASPPSSPSNAPAENAPAAPVSTR